jgi:glycosyltransferase involved in cell wall biosynthesis
MNIWIINHHALTPDMGGGTRHYDFAQELQKRGHSVTIFASSFHYANYCEMKEYGKQNYINESINGVDFIWFKTPPYSHNGLARVKNMLAFMRAVLKFDKKRLPKPDVIIGSSVHLFAVYAAYRLSQKYNVPFVFEVRDLWPQTLIDMGMSRFHPFVISQALLERFLYKRADHIITLLPKADQYIEKFDIKKDVITWISNGTKLRKSSEKKELFKNSKFNIVYAGSMGKANDLEKLIAAAKILEDKKNIHFTLIGSGAQKEKLKSMASQNVTFVDALPKEELFDYLQAADLLYVGLQNLPLYRFGMSMNKVFDYMSVKKPILFVGDIEPNIIEIAGAGITLKEADSVEVAKRIEQLSKTDKQILLEYGVNGYNYLVKNFTIEVLCDKLEEVLYKVLKR